MEDLMSKQNYQKPEIKTEKMTAVAGVCNGKTKQENKNNESNGNNNNNDDGGGIGNRKASTGAPNYCHSNKLKS